MPKQKSKGGVSWSHDTEFLMSFMEISLTNATWIWKHLVYRRPGEDTEEIFKTSQFTSLKSRSLYMATIWESNVSNYTICFLSRWCRISFNTLLNTRHYPQELCDTQGAKPGGWRWRCHPAFPWLAVWPSTSYFPFLGLKCTLKIETRW